MWGTQRRNQITFDLGDGAGGGAERSLRDRLLVALNGQLGGSVVAELRLAGNVPDIFFQSPETNRSGVVELKIGDPNLPLPSSTVVQMVRLAQSVEAEPELSGQQVTPIVVTNYLVSHEQEQDLAANRIRLVRVSDNASASGIAEQIKLALAKQ